MRTLIWIIVLAIIVGGYFLIKQGPAPAAPTGEVKVGFMGPLTGDAASYGESIKRGVDLAIQEMALPNVKLIYEDSQCEGKDAVNAIRKLIDVDKVQAIIGEVCSGATLAAAPVANANRVPMVSAASTSPDISDAGEYIFRTVPSDALQGSFGAELVYDKGLRKLAVLYSNEEYGVGFNTVVSARFEELGGEVVSQESFERGATDIRTQLTKVKAAGPDALYLIINSPASSVAALKQIKELGVDAVIFASEGLKAQEIIDDAGEAAEGLLLTSVSGGSAEFSDRHQAEYGEGPGPFAAQGYDAAKAILLTIQDGAATGEAIKDALFELSFEGATGTIDFDSNGDIVGNYEIFVVENGEFVLQK